MLGYAPKARAPGHESADAWLRYAPEELGRAMEVLTPC
jgi:hypothetical protein